MGVRILLAAVAAAPVLASFAWAQEPPPAQPPAPAPAPEAAAPPDGKAILEGACTTCHGLDFITDHRKSRASWEFVVSQMISRGAELTPDDAALVVDYLAKTYPAEDPKPPAS